ncbi:hypothetical protein L211DRAFT_836847 [Terfezia boudieri ATCC MYA-4762]|uniref:EamA domain-containing protein n=1 Tax=Terfezia boudieri ATCC MYA-4762 TaxID=1051890 RepID=A0A3N4LPY4_9PEZI|nr:hypothetical protein L211DRAFT_836847 [Terfezia boudieri ATCC MYA-4762]
MDQEISRLLAGSGAATSEEEIAEATTIARQYGSVDVPPDSRVVGDEPAPVRSRSGAFFHDNRGLFFLAVAQLFGGIMGMLTRLLETSLPSGQRYHALQILFARMIITWLCCMIWMWWTKVPHMPLGQRQIRGLLVARGTAGFIGVFGLYYSLSYLPLPDATVITFLIPTMMSFVCSIMPSLKEPFTTQEKAGGLISFVGVILIARPTFMFHSRTIHNTLVSIAPVKTPYVSPHQRTLAVAVALVGVLGAASAYSIIRVIGHRAHPLISVTYFAAMTTICSLIGLFTIPSVGGILVPQGLLEWGLLFGLGISGFLLQFLLTKGLQLEKAGRAGSLVYTQMIWAVIFEWLVWGNAVSGLSLVGAALILGGAAWVNLQKWRGAGKETGKKARSGSVGGRSIEGDAAEAAMEHDGLQREEEA